MEDPEKEVSRQRKGGPKKSLQDMLGSIRAKQGKKFQAEGQIL